MNYFDRGTGQTGKDQAGQVVLDESVAKVALPTSFDIATVQFDRSGPDLEITSSNGESILVTSYFSQVETPEIIMADGVVLPSSIVSKLAGPVAPGQFAQAAGAATSEPIGTVETADGAVEAVRADGTRVTLKVGDSVFQGDELVTAKGAAVGITFADETTFALGEEGRMVLDEMVYDPGAQDGAIGLTLLSGAMTFVSGAVAKVNPDAMQITTPVATIGIRGTAGVTDGKTIGLLAEKGGQVGEISVTTPNGQTVTVNVENGMVTASANGVSGVVIGTLQNLISLGGNSLGVIAQAGLVSDAISKAIAKLEAAANENANPENQVDLNSAEDGVDIGDFLANLNGVGQDGQIIDFLKALGDELGRIDGIIIGITIKEFNAFNAGETTLNTSLTSANSGSSLASAAETKIQNATDETGAANTLANAGVTTTSGVVTTLYASFNSFGAALSISSAAQSIAEMASTAFYTTGEGVSGEDFALLAAKIKLASDAVYKAAEDVDKIVDAIIAGQAKLLAYVVANFSTITNGAVGATAIDLAVQTFIAANDDDYIDAELVGTGLSISAVDVILDTVTAAVDNISAEIDRIQAASTDPNILSGFETGVIATKAFVVAADAVVETAKAALAEDADLTAISTNAGSAKTQGLAAAGNLDTLKSGAFAAYKTAQAAFVNARVLDSAAAAEIQNTAQQTSLAKATETYKAAANSGTAGEDYLTGSSSTKLYGPNGNADTTDGSEGAVLSARTGYATAQTELQAAISNLQEASGNVLTPLINQAKAAAKLEVLQASSATALDKVQAFALEEAEASTEVFIDTLKVGLQSLQAVMSAAKSALTGSSVDSLTTASTQMDAIVSAMNALSTKIDGSGLINGASELDQAAKQSAIDDGLAIKTLLENLSTQLTTVKTDLAGEASALGYINALSTAIGTVTTAFSAVLVKIDAIEDNAVEAATTLDTSVTTINEAIAETNSATDSIVSAVQTVADTYSSNTTFASNAATTSQSGQNADVVTQFAKELTDLWEGVYGQTKSETDAAQTDYTAKNTLYQNALSAETTAKNLLVTELAEFKVASTALYTAEKDYAYDQAYLVVGQAIAEERAEKFLKDQETSVEEALAAAVQAAKNAAAAAEVARLASQDTGFNSTTTAQAVADATAAKDAADAALIKAHNALVKADKLDPANDNVATNDASYYPLAKASPPDWQARFDAMTASLDTIKSIAKVNGGSYTDVNGNVENFTADGSIKEFLDSTSSYNTLAEKLTAGNAGEIDAAKLAATTAATAADTAQKQEGIQRADGGEKDALAAAAQATEAQGTAQAAANAASTTSLSTQANALMDQIRAATQTATAQKDIAVLASNNADNATTPDAAINFAKTAEAAAAAAQTATNTVIALSKSLSKLIVDWAGVEVKAQLALAQAAETSTIAADASATSASASINTNYTPATVTQAAVDAVTSLTATVVTQAGIAQTKSTASDAAADAAEAALEIAKIASSGYAEFAQTIQVAADDVGLARLAASGAENANQNANSKLTTANLSKKFIETNLEAQVLQAASKKAAEDAATEATAKAQADADAKAEAKAAEDAAAVTNTEALANVAAAKAALAQTYAEAAQTAAIKADEATATAQYELARTAADEAKAASTTAQETAAGHGTAALAKAAAAFASLTSAQSSLAVALAAKDNAGHSAESATSWRDGSASTGVVTTEVASVAAKVISDNAQTAATAALAAVESAKFGANGSVNLQISASSAEAVLASETKSQQSALDRLNAELVKAGVVGVTVDANTDLDNLVTVTLNGVAEKSIIEVWVNVFDAAKTTTASAQTALTNAQSAATNAENQVTIAETEAAAAVSTAQTAAEQTSDLIAKAAAAQATETLGRLAADLQGESTVDDALSVLTTSKAALSDNDNDATNDATSLINTQFTVISTISQIGKDALTNTDVTNAEAALTAAKAALATALIAKQNADAALDSAQHAIEKFYVTKSGLSDPDNAKWVAVEGSSTVVIHVDSVSKYNSVLSNIDVASKQASQVANTYSVLDAKVNEAIQNVTTIESLKQEADFADVAAVQGQFDSFVEKTEGVSEQAVDSAYDTISAAKSAIIGIISLINGASVNSSDAIVGTVPAELSTAFDLIKSALTDANTLRTAVEPWSDAGEVAGADITTVGNDIAALLAKVEQAATAFNSAIPNLSGTAATAAPTAVSILTNADNATTAAQSAVTNLQTLQANEATLNGAGSLETALAAVEPAKTAVVNATTSANEAGQASTSLHLISDTLQENAAASALAAAAAARAADLAAAESALTSVNGLLTAAQTAAANALAAYSTAKDTYLANATTAAANATTAANLTVYTSANHTFTDLSAKITLVQANTSAQKALGANSSTAAALNVTSEVAKAKAAWEAAVQNVTNAQNASNALTTAVESARTASAANQSVSQYRQTAETNAQTLKDQNTDAQANLATANAAKTAAGTASTKVVAQAEIAVTNRAILDVSESVAAKTIIAQSAVDTAIVEMAELKASTKTATEQAQAAANQVDAAATDLNAHPGLDAAGIVSLLADEKAAATTAQGLAVTNAGNAASNYADIVTALANATAARDAAQTLVTQAGANANSVAQAELADAKAAVTELTTLKSQAEQINIQAQSALAQANEAVSSIDQLIGQTISAADAQAQAIASYEAEADQAAATATQTATRGQSIADSIGKDNADPVADTGLYYDAIALANSVKTAMQTWYDANSGNADYTAARTSVNTLIDRVDNDNNDLYVQLDAAEAKVVAANATLTEALNAAQAAAALTPADLTEAKANALTAANNAKIVETQTAILEAQRSVITRLLSDVKAVQDGFSQIKAEADAAAAFTAAQTAALATPDAKDDTITSLVEDAGNVINLFADHGSGADARADGGTITLVSVSKPTHGKLEIVDAAAGTVRYTPDKDYNGSDTFTYTISNGVGVGGVIKYDSATATLTIDNTNDNPVAVKDFASSTSETATVVVNPVLNDTDVDKGDTLSLSSITSNGTTINSAGSTIDIYKAGVVVGTATWVAGTQRISFTPAANAFKYLAEGAKDTVDFTYQVSDGHGGTASSTITITMTGTNDAPVVTNSTVNSTEDVSGGVHFTTGNFTYSDVDTGDAVETIKITKLPYHVVVGKDVNNQDITYEEVVGTLTLNGVAVTAHTAIPVAQIANLVYTPAADFNGDVFIDWTANDGSLSSASAAKLTINFSAVNDAPVVTSSVVLNDAVEDTSTYTFTKANLLANASDVDGDSLTIYNNSVSATTGGGTIQYNNNDTWTYTAASNYTGPVVISYQVSDGTVQTAGSASFDITGANDAPTFASTLSGSVAEDDVLTEFPLGATDPEGDAITYSLATGAGPQHGSVVFNTNGTLTYTPLADYVGTETFQVVATDSNGAASSPQTVQIIVTNVNDAPTNITLAKLNVDENADGGTVGLLNTVDIDTGDTHTYEVYSDVAATTLDTRFEVVSGSLKLKSGFTLDYETDASVTLTVKTTDLGGLSTTKTFSIAVNDINEAPTGISVSNLLVDENAAGAVIGTLTTTDQDANELHSYAVYSDSGATTLDTNFEVVAGELKLKSGVSLDYETQSSYNVYVKVTDQAGTGLSYIEPITVTVNDLNEPSVITFTPNDPYFVEDGAAQTVFPSLSIADVDSTDLTGATIVISNASADDVLNFTDAGGITGTYTYADGVGTLVLTGTASLTTYETAIGSVTYETLSQNPVMETRNISLSVNDGVNESAPVINMVSIISANDAPIVSDANVQPDLTAIIEDNASSTGTLVSDLVAQMGASDAEGDVLGIAITDVTSTNGVWEYFRNATSQWTQMSGLSDSSAKVLSADSLVRFVPNADFAGTEQFQFRLWDGTTGVNQELNDLTTLGIGGLGAFGADALTANITVTPANDAPVFVDVEDNSIVTFDGVDDYITMGKVDGLANMSSGTISTWVKLDSLTDGLITITQMVGINTIAGFGVGVAPWGATAGQLAWRPSNFPGDIALSTGTVPDDGQWHHVALSFDGNSANFYIDGVSAGGATGANYSTVGNLFQTDNTTPIVDFTSAQPLIGGYADGTYNLSGGMSDFAVYNTKLSATGISDIVANNVDPSDANLELYYNFEGGTATDLSGNGYSGTFQNGLGVTTVSTQTPITVHDLFGTEDTDIVFTEADLLTNFVDVEGDNLSITQVVIDGNVITPVAGTYTFSPDANVFGIVGMQVSVSDGTDTTVGNYQINLASVNDAPDLTPLTQTAVEDTAITFTLTDLMSHASDVEDDTLSVYNVAGVNLATLNATPQATTNGMLSYDSQTEIFTFVPNANFAGAEQIYYSVYDGTDIETSTIDLTYTAVNDAPVFDGMPFSRDVVQFDGNDYISTGVTSQVSTAFTIDLKITTQIAADGFYKPIISKSGTTNGTAEFDLQVQTDGNLNFFMGNGAGYAVQVDGGILSDNTDYHITVTFDGTTANLYLDGVNVGTQAVSGSPVATANPIEIGHFLSDGGANHYFEGVIADVRVWDSAIAPANFGQPVTGSEAGLVTYLPLASIDAGTGTTPDLVVANGDAVLGTATVGDVAEPVLATVQKLDTTFTLTLDEDTSLSGTLSASDAEDDAMTFALDTDAGNGSVVVNANGTFTYTPDADFAGTDSFVVSVSDGNGGITTKTISVGVAPINDAPMIVGSTLPAGLQGTEYTITAADLLANVTDVDGDALTISNITVGTGATVSYDSQTEILTVTPDVGYSGPIDITYDVSDSMVTTTVTAHSVIGGAPTDIYFSAAASVDENVEGAFIGTLLATDADDAPGTHTFTTSDTNFHIVDGDKLYMNDGFSFNYEESQGGVGSVYVEATDPDGLTHQQFVNFTINNVNEAPIITSELSSIHMSGTDFVAGELVIANAGPVTMEAYFNWSNSLSYGETLIRNGLEGVNGNGYSISIITDANDINRLALNVGGVGTLYFDVPQPSNTWTQAAVSYDGTTWSAYVNGQSVGLYDPAGTITASIATPITPTVGFEIGTGFSGYIDEVRMWDDARTQAEIQGTAKSTLTGSETNLVGLWNFNEYSGSNVFDHATTDGAQNGISYTDVGEGSYAVNEPSRYNTGMLNSEIQLYSTPSSNVAYVLSGINVYDPDFSSGEMIFTLNVPNATIFIDGRNGGLSNITGEGTSTVTITGSGGNISNLFYQGLVSYQLDAGAPTSGNITITANDQIGGVTTTTIPYVVDYEPSVVLTGTAYGDNIVGYDGDDTLTGSGANDRLDGAYGDDLLISSAGYSTLVGGQGNDVVSLSVVEGQLIFGDTEFYPYGTATSSGGVDNFIDFDVLSYNNLAAGIDVDVNNHSVSSNGYVDHFYDIELVVGTDFSDSFIGGSDNDIFAGMAGQDTYVGGLGSDELRFDKEAGKGAGGITITLGNGDGGMGSVTDTFGYSETFTSIERVRGSMFDDTMSSADTTGRYERFSGMAGADTIDGGAGVDDEVSYANDIAGVTVNLNTGTATDGWGDTDTLSNLEYVRGSMFNDSITAKETVGVDTYSKFYGLAGDDTFTGVAGTDNYEEVSYEKDVYYGATQGIYADWSADGVKQVTDSFGDTDTLINIDRIRGTDFDDTLIGGSGQDVFRAQGGNDYFDGGAGIDRIDYTQSTSGVTVNLESGIGYDGMGGTDTLLNVEQVRGSHFSDTLTGSTGVNQLRGYAGSDILTGGAGGDNFYYQAGDSTSTNPDIITDFDSASGDYITFSGMTGIQYAPVSAGDFMDVTQAITDITTNGLDNTMSFFTISGDGYLYVKDTDNSSNYNDTLIQLQGVTTPMPLASLSGLAELNYAPTVIGLVDDTVAVVFDGVDDSIYLGRGAGDNLELTNDLTIESWLKLNSVGSRQTLMSFGAVGEAASQNVAYELAILADGDIAYRHEYGAGLDVELVFNTNLNTGDWHHISVVRDAGTGSVTLYLDGVSQGTQTYDPVNEAPAPAADSTLSFGSAAANAGFLDGEIADVRLWSDVRTATEIADNYDHVLTFPGEEPNLAGYWNFKDAVDNQEAVADLSGHGNDIRVFDGLIFNGVDNYVETIGTRIVGNHSATAWINTTSTTLGGVLYGTNGTDQSFDISISATGELIVDIQGVASVRHYETNTGYNLNDGLWHNIGYSNDTTGNLELYIDGTVVPVGNMITPTESGVFTDFSLDATIGFGRDSSATNYFDGQIADVGLYGAPMGAADFSSIYNYGGGNSGFNRIGFWSFDDGVGTTVSSYADSANMDATAFNNPVWSTPTPGLNDYAQVSLALAPDQLGYIDIGNVTTTSGDLTVSAVINPVETGAAQEIFSLGGTKFVLEITALGDLQVSLNNGAITETYNSFGDFNQWSHVAATYSNGTVTIYVNGESKGSITATPFDITGSNAVTFGTDFVGSMGELQLWDTALSMGEVQTLTNGVVDGTEQSLIGYWTMEDGSGTTIVDAAGNYNGTITGGGATSWNAPLPTLINDSYVIEVEEDRLFNSQLLATDPEGNAYTFSLNTNGINGFATINADGSFTYKPNVNYFGEDSFSVTVTDSLGNSSNQSISVSVWDSNDTPIANFDTLSFELNSSNNILDLIANDTDQDGDALSVQMINGQTDTGNGIVVNGGIIHINAGVASFTPNNGFAGTVYLNYTISDTAGNYTSGNAQITVNSDTYGTVGMDTLSGTTGNDNIHGLGGDDTFIGSTGSDWFDGGAGNDTVNYLGSSDGVTVNLSDPNYQFISTSQGSDKLTDIENVMGSAFDDTLIGDNATNILEGFAGADTIYGAGGADTLFGGGADAARDVFVYQSGTDSVVGSADTISDFNADDAIQFVGMAGVSYDGMDVSVADEATFFLTTLAGLADNAVYFVNATSGTNFLYVKGAGTGTTSFDGTMIYLPTQASAPATNMIFANNNPINTIVGTENADTVLGTAGSDVINGLAGNDELQGGAGDDIYMFSLGNDTIVDSLGNNNLFIDFDNEWKDFDLVNMTHVGNDFVVTLSDGTTTASTTVQDNYINANDNFLQIKIDQTVTTYKMFKGVDASAAGTNVAIAGTTAAEVLIASSLDSVLAGGLGDTLLGNYGNDFYVVNEGVAVINDYNGGGESGLDVVSFAGLTAGVDVDFSTGVGTYLSDNATFTIANVQEFSGSSYNDIVVGGLSGSVYTNVLYGEGGDDTLTGSSALSDTLDGGDGNDLLIATAGGDIFNGGFGNDTIDFSAATEAVNVNLSVVGDGIINGTGDQNVSTEYGAIDISNVENVNGTIFADMLVGDAQNNIINGMDGDDLLVGQAGNDTISGGAGFDTLVGGDGADVLDGGAGNDIFSYTLNSLGTEGNDQILNFSSVDDTLQFMVSTANQTPFASMATGLHTLQTQTFLNVANVTGLTNVGGSAKFIYISSNTDSKGELIYAANGQSSIDNASYQTVATFDSGTSLSANDIVINVQNNTV